MKSAILTKTSSFVKAIQAAVGIDRPDHLPISMDRAQSLLSDPVQLSQLCTTCFWASLEIEERREVRGTLSICTPHPRILARHLDNSPSVSVSNLVSLLVASLRSPLAVHGGPDGLHIWGLIDTEPDGLIRLRITGNGTLQASRSGKVLALLQEGEVSIPKAADVTSLAHLMATTLDKKQFLELKSNIPPKIIRRVATMIHHGHGGALVVVNPNEHSWERSLRFKYTFRKNETYYLNNINSNSLPSFGQDKKFRYFMHEDCIDSTHNQDIKLNHSSTVKDMLSYRVGELSLIDGAVVIDTDLNLYGFGAKLEVKQTDFSITALNAITGSMLGRLNLSQLGGMRHQSAACFVNDNHTADVFVVSQDGNFSLFCWSDKLQSVAVVKNLEHFIWEF
jgi:hypothetical protein